MEQAAPSGSHDMRKNGDDCPLLRKMLRGGTLLVIADRLFLAPDKTSPQL